MRTILKSLLLLLIFVPLAYSDEYPITSNIKMYNRELREIQSRITFFPEEAFFSDNALFLYAGNVVLTFGKNANANTNQRAAFIEILDKSIEWAAVARENNVRRLTRSLETRMGLIGILHGQLEPLYVEFTFSIQEVNRAVEIVLLLNYKTTYEMNAQSPGGFIAFKERDFPALKEIFSESYLARFFDEAAEQRRIEELFQ